LNPGPGSFERQERVNRALTYALAVGFYAIAYALCCFAYGPVAGFLVSTPVLGVYGALLLVYRAPGMRHWLRWLVLRKVQGIYQAFDGVAVRIAWRDGQCRVAAHDVFEVLRERLDARACRHLVAVCGAEGFTQDEKGDWWFGEPALLQWLEKYGAHADRRAWRFRIWFEREVFPPMHRKAELERR
jgi:hypothetical protein